MSFIKKMLIVGLTLFLGITAINQFLFSSYGGTRCNYCIDSHLTSVRCNEFCEPEGGCGGWQITGSAVCYDGNCIQDTKLFCGTEPENQRVFPHIPVTHWGCWECFGL